MAFQRLIGGNYNVLATDIYKEVVGQQNFQMGAVISMVLLVPAMIAFFIDRYSRKKQISLLTSRSVVFKPKKHFNVDMIMLAILFDSCNYYFINDRDGSIWGTSKILAVQFAANLIKL